jgi:glutathione synthase
MNTLFVTDPLSGLQADVDATVGLMDAAQREDAAVWVCGPEDLVLEGGRLTAHARRVVLRPRTRGADHRWRIAPTWYDVVERASVDVAATCSVVMLRIDPPVDARYLHTTYLLDLVSVQGVRVCNDPQGIRVLHEKLVALRFPDLCPSTIVTSSPGEVVAFTRNLGATVVKPVDGFAGTDVWLLEAGNACRALAESATGGGRRHVIVQEYLPDVSAGNKRLFLLDGKIFGAVLRRPEPDDFRIGPPVAVAEVDGDDRRIAGALAPLLRANGIALAGVDVIDGRLIEVNVTCPGGMHKTDALLGTDLSGSIMRRLLRADQTESSTERLPA